MLILIIITIIGIIIYNHKKKSKYSKIKPMTGIVKKGKRTIRKGDK